jgi:hypothetical protein
VRDPARLRHLVELVNLHEQLASQVQVDAVVQGAANVRSVTTWLIIGTAALAGGYGGTGAVERAG